MCYFSAAMALASSEQVLQATHQWLKPLAHVLLSCGITWREFAALARTTYVEVATENFGKRGRPATHPALGHSHCRCRGDVWPVAVDSQTKVHLHTPLGLNVAVKVSGTFDANGVLVASKVKAASDPSGGADAFSAAQKML